jgi:Domain of unknown function (DUF4158)
LAALTPAQANLAGDSVFFGLRMARQGRWPHARAAGRGTARGRSSLGRAELDRDWLGRVCHLGAADLEQARRRSEDRTRLGYALQLVTVRAIGTFLPDPMAIPAPVLAAVARQLDVADLAVLDGYSELAVRWRHTAEIRDRYG